MRAVLPLLYLAAGWAMVRLGLDWRRGMSRALSLVVIPVVIVFHVAGGSAALAALMLCALVWMLALFGIAQWLSREPVDALCLCYLNIGWLGLPVAASALGPPAVSLFTAFYIASSILGNALGPAWLLHRARDASAIGSPAAGSARTGWWRHAWRTPALRAMLVGLCLLPCGPWLAAHAAWLDQGARVLLGVLGMMVLGAWLAHAPLSVADLLHALRWFALRAALSLLVLALLWFITSRFGRSPLQGQASAAVLLSLLPPAANILVLETEALGSGRSATRIAAATVWSLGAIALYVVGSGIARG